MKFPKALLLVGTQRGFSSLLCMRMDVGQRELTIYDPDFPRVISLYCLQCREQATAERTLKIRKFDDGDRRSFCPARRITRGGNFSPKRVEVRLHSIFVFQPADQRFATLPSTLFNQVLPNLGQRLLTRSRNAILIRLVTSGD